MGNRPGSLTGEESLDGSLSLGLAACEYVEQRPTPLVIVSDPGQDLDDEMCFIMLRYLAERNLVSIRGIIATLRPAFDRARLTKGTLDLLGLKNVPVAVGTDGGDTNGTHKATFAESAPYMPSRHSDQAYNMPTGRRLLFQIFQDAEPKSLSLVCIASMKDAALFLRDNQALFVEKINEVIIMGGVMRAPVEWEIQAEDGKWLPSTCTPPHHQAGAGSQIQFEHDGDQWLMNFTSAREGVASYKDRQMQLRIKACCNPLIPDKAHNNEFDPASAAFLYSKLQELGVPMVVLCRHAAYAAKMPRNVYDQLALLGSSIGVRLRNAQRTTIEQLWTRCCAPEDSIERGGLPARCDRDWFINTFCGGKEGVPPRGPADTIWDLLDGFMQYDTLAVLAAIPRFRRQLFDPLEVTGPHDTKHLVIGENAENHGVRDPSEMIRLLRRGFTAGLAMNHHHKAHIIMLTQLRWDNHADEIMACLMLRSLYNLSLVNCVGIIVSSVDGDDELPLMRPSVWDEQSPTQGLRSTEAPTQGYPQSGLRSTGASVSASRTSQRSPGFLHGDAEHEAEDMISTLNLLGLEQIPVHVAGAGGAHTELLEMYKTSPPAGVTLVLTASTAEAATFARENPVLFREKTQRIVLMGGADVGMDEASGREILMPDATAQNNVLDLEGTKELFNIAQELSVPLVVLSRHASRACQVPRELFDELAEHGDSLGKHLFEVERDGIQELWRCVNARDPEDRRRLPDRCDREWFRSTFCPGSATLPGPEDNIWPHVEAFNIYNPLALCAALPLVVERFLQATKVEVRSATHHIVGLSKDCPGVENPNSVRELIYQSLFKGAWLNRSVYDLEATPRLPLSLGKADDVVMWEFDRTDEALSWLLPATISRQLEGSLPFVMESTEGGAAS